MHLSQLAITVRDYDEAIAFYVNVLGFSLLEDRDMGSGKRWVRVRPPAGDPNARGGEPSSGPTILLSKAVGEQQLASVGNQTGGRVFLFMETDDFWRDFNALAANGVTFLGPPREEAYGTVAVFVDLYGNKFDLIGRPLPQ